MSGDPNPFKRPSWIPLQACIGLHLLAAGGYCWMGPGGFAFLSRSFVEHQVLAPLLLAVSAVALLGAWRPRPAMIACGVIYGFWVPVLLVFAWTGTTKIARGLWPILFCFLSGFILYLLGAKRSGARRGPSLSGAAVGTALGVTFLVCTWAPPASTTPRNVAAPHPETLSGPSFLTDGNLRVQVGKDVIIIEDKRRQRHVLVYPALEFYAATEGGWGIFQHRRVELPDWKVGRGLDGVTRFHAEGEELRAWGWVEIVDGCVKIHCATNLKREIAAHLGAAVRVHMAGAVTIEGEEWPVMDPLGRVSFLAFRNDRLELLRGSRQEKGPFTTLASWDPRDPILRASGWSVQVRGWAEQGAMAESPTAGWGLSQASLDRSGSEFYWGLATTSAGRGWHSVRTREGTYVFDIIVAGE